MILINLLPYREARRKQRKQAFFSGLALAALVGLLAIALAWVLLQSLIGNQQSRNSYLAGRDRPAGRADQGHRHAARGNRQPDPAAERRGGLAR
jgi:Tfp pilus assembly protein PilN